MRKLPGLLTIVAAVGVLALQVGGLSQASATPPSGEATITDHGRAQQTAGKVVVPSGRDVLSSVYTVAPGGDTGWRTGPGTTVLGVVKGTLGLMQASDGCAHRDVAAGSAVVVQPGQFRLHNAGKEPVQLFANFTGLPAGGPAPLTDGPAEPAPACAGVSAAVVPSGVAQSDSFRGGISAYPAPQEGHANHHGHGESTDASGPIEFSVEAGKDTMMNTFHLKPGFSTGWFVHTDHIAIITKGTWAFYEAREGKCEKVEEYKAGDAWAHGPHTHMGAVQGNEDAEITLFGFNLKHGEAMPVFGSAPDHFDFSPPPPSECPTQLR